jgi:hypothetical protein
MTTIVVDAAMRAKLVSATSVAEVRDEDGTLIGRFVPVREDVGELDHGLTPQELEQSLSPDCKTYSTAEVLAHLRGLLK